MPAPKPDQKMIDRVTEMLGRNLSYREIAKILGKDVKSVYRWAQYGRVGKLSTSRGR